jgi:putative hemolysin
MTQTIVDREGMRDTHPKRPLFRLPEAPTPLIRRVYSPRSVERLLKIDGLNRLYDRTQGAGHWRAFIDRVLAEMEVTFRVSREDLARIPKAGRLVVVANHPFGAVEGMILGAILARVRPDVRIMANYLLGQIPDIRDLFILVDPFGSPEARTENTRPLRQCLQHLRGDGVLGVFPAGEVSSLNLSSRTVADPAWSPTIAGIVRRTGASVLPVFFDGGNSRLFHLLGLIHPRLRTAMLPREFLRMKGRCIEVRIGSVIPHDKLDPARDDVQWIKYLRQRTYLLQHRTPTRPRPQMPRRQAEVIAPTARELLARDVAALAPDQRIATQGELAVYHAETVQMPNLIREIGRLREITFRATGEGTGRETDLDRFDPAYSHLFVWNDAKQEVVGSYRVGMTDRLLARGGIDQLYTSTLFDYSPALLARIGPSLELGRSFIRAEYQRSYAPLLLLWKGIGGVVVRNPQYRNLIGPVSISNTYQSVSRQMMVRFLQLHHMLPDLAGLVRPRNPFKPLDSDSEQTDAAVTGLRDDDDLSALVADVEPDQKGVPILVRQYLKVGAKMLAFNVDPDFSDVVDALILVDLTKTETKILDRYLTRDGRISFLAHHAGGR